MFCCSVATFACFGTHYFCDPCHDKWNDYYDPENIYDGIVVEFNVKDCKGVSCPLGLPHPPASFNPRQSVFPLGCGICRSEKVEFLQKRDVVQIFDPREVQKELVRKRL